MTRKRTLYTPAFRQQALEKVYSRGNQSVESVALQLNMNHWTLKNWMRADKQSAQSTSTSASKRPHEYSTAERFNLVMQSHSLDETALGAFCRHKGIFPHHLLQWQKDFETTLSARENESRVRDLMTANKSLERELKRKEKALAEAAALLVLQKKFQAFWEEKEK